MVLNTMVVQGARNGATPVTTALWGVGTAGVTLVASQAVNAASNDWAPILIALITGLSGVAASIFGAAVLSRNRDHKRDLDDDVVVVPRAEYDRLRDVERRHRRGR